VILSFLRFHLTWCAPATQHASCVGAGAAKMGIEGGGGGRIVAGWGHPVQSGQRFGCRDVERVLLVSQTVHENITVHAECSKQVRVMCREVVVGNGAVVSSQTKLNLRFFVAARHRQNAY
jgi:hypothetical protein